MNGSLRAMGAAAVALALAGAVAGAEPRPFSERYPTLSRRNIFDPDRGRPRPSVESARPAIPAPPPRRESVQLLGVALTESDAFAHLSGSNAPAVARAGDRVGDLRVVEIRDDAVVFESEGRQWTLPVGRRLVRFGAQEWTMAAGESPMVPAASSAAAPPAAGAGGNAGTAAPTGGMSEVMRRLMERRQREMGP